MQYREVPMEFIDQKQIDYGTIDPVKVAEAEMERKEALKREDERIQNTIVTVGEFIRVLQKYNSNAKIVFSYPESFGDYMDRQLSSSDVEVNDNEDCVTFYF